MKSLDRLLWLCYGNHPKAGHQKEIAEDLVLVLRNEDQMPRRELMDYLEFDPDDENEEQQFDRVLRKLRGDNELGIEAVTAFKAVYGDGREMHYSTILNVCDAHSVETSLIKELAVCFEEQERRHFVLTLLVSKNIPRIKRRNTPSISSLVTVSITTATSPPRAVPLED